MLPSLIVDLRDLHLLSPVEGKAGSGALEAEIRDRSGVEFDGLDRRCPEGLD
jgi:hypothetical protein